MLELNKVHCGDCLDLMTQIPDHSIDLVLCDLPYAVTAQQQWDTLIDFKLLWTQYQRIITDHGALIFTATEPFRTKLIVSNFDWFRYDLIWEKNKTFGFLNAKKQPLRQHEAILVFYKYQPVYNPQKTSGHKPVNSYTRRTQSLNHGQEKLGLSGGGSTKRYPTSIIKIPIVNNDAKDKYHPAQKPVELGEYLIKTYSNEEQVVLDNCRGSGSFLVAAKNQKRKFIGIEIDPHFHSIAEQRLI